MTAREKVGLLERVSKLGDVLDEIVNAEHQMPTWKSHLLHEKLGQIETLIRQKDRRNIA